MKRMKYLSAVFLFLIPLISMSQEEPRPIPKKKIIKVRIEFYTDMQCKISIDGKSFGIIETSMPKEVIISQGKHKVVAISTTNKFDNTSFYFNATNSKNYCEIKLQNIHDQRIIKEQNALNEKNERILKAKSDSLKKIKQKLFDQLPSEFTDKIGLKFIKVVGGSYNIGCTSEQLNDCDPDEKPSIKISVENFFIGKYEVTQKQWSTIMGSVPPEVNVQNCDDCPVVGVNIDDINSFIIKLNLYTGKTYRLPNEAEWEYAARGGCKRSSLRDIPDNKYSGSNNIDDVAWYNKNSNNKIHPVGLKKPNELGIYDMSGNAWEWCSNSYYNYGKNDMKYNQPKTEIIDRGGGWYSSSGSCRVSCRNREDASSKDASLGFRLVLVH